VLWLDEVTFLVGGRTEKEGGEKEGGKHTLNVYLAPVSPGHTTRINAWGAIG